MLPTHFARLPEESNPSQHSGVSSSSAPQYHTPDVEGFPADGNMTPTHASTSEQSYPPAQQAIATGGVRRRAEVAHASSHAADNQKGVIAFTVQPQVPYSPKTDSHADSASQGRNGSARATMLETSPPRWHTVEFRFYALVFITMVPLMIWVPISLSQPSSPTFSQYAKYLEPGWMFGRQRDDSDFQYKSFRDYVPVLLLVMAAYLGLSKATEKLGQQGDYEAISSTIIRPHRRAFLCIFTAIFVFTLHGLNTLKLLAVLLANYSLARSFGGTIFGVIAAWTFNIAILFAVHMYDGFPLEKLSSSLAWLDEFNGLLPRWQINFNISMLRLVSFALDYHWSRKNPRQEEQQRVDSGAPVTDARLRGDVPLADEEYSLVNYLLYVLYPPLFIAGPIMTFNDFVRQMHNPLPVPSAYTMRYALRLASSMLSMEFILHFMYVNAIKDAKAWRGTTPLQLSMIGFWNLIVVWLKLLIPWRFFRLWALADGVDPPENMIRCMANNYSTLGFWRSWHRSYNLWIVRYIYVPVGGAKNAIPATLLVFTFVALWHDLSLKLLTWGWLVTLFILPEIMARKLVSRQRYGKTAWYRHVAAAGGVFNVLLMMTANLVGFAIGTDGIQYMWQQLLSSWSGISFMFAACAVLFVGVQVMFEYREEELRHGIDRKC